MSDGAPGSAPASGLRQALARAGASLVGLVRTRIDLASVEFLEARERTVAQLILAVVAVMFLSFAVLLASALVVVLFWDTYRTAALAAVTLLHATIGAVALWRLKANSRSAPSPFAATLAELERDGQWLAEAARDRTNP